jgi:predicted phosphodiesterase
MYLKGRNIVVVDDGQLYSSYEEMAKKLKLTNWKREKSFKEGLKGKIIGVARNEDNHDEIIVGIDCDGDQYVISLKGVEIIETEEEDIVPKEEYFKIENLAL